MAAVGAIIFFIYKKVFKKILESAIHNPKICNLRICLLFFGRIFVRIGRIPNPKNNGHLLNFIFNLKAQPTWKIFTKQLST